MGDAASKLPESDGPLGFPFGVDDKVAARVLGPDGETWFGGTLLGVYPGGIVLGSMVDDGVVMWLPWAAAVVRSAVPGEFTAHSVDQPVAP